jgi:hypothetical protein
VRVVTTLVVHRVAEHLLVRRPLCDTPPIYGVTSRTCTYVEHVDGRVDVTFVDLPVDCMSCLVAEARSATWR